MAEAILREIAGERFEVKSAGLEAGTLNPLVIEVLKEINIDISNKKTQSVFDLLKAGELFSYVITVCDQGNAERCPVFPGQLQQIAWNFPNPSSFEGTSEEKLAQTRKVRDEIKQTILHWQNNHPK